VLAVLVFRSFYGSSEPGTPFHNDTIPSNPVRPPLIDYSNRVPGVFSEPEIKKGGQERLTPLYHVVLLDDDDHTYEYVIEMLQKLFAASESAAWNNAVEVDTMGRTIVMTCELAQAEFGRDQIHAYGPDWRMPRSKGSMRATIEPAGAGQ
jgi:ATP-dependent Clp protease adaptor protein ClpS